MSRFCIITPTIGRPVLRRCVESLEHQMFDSFFHIVIGDGPQPEWVRKLCMENSIQYQETEKKEATGAFGAAPRNFALDTLPPCDYVVFLDDDNELLEPALYQMNQSIVEHHEPPLLYQEILFTSKYTTDYVIFPKNPERLVVEREWDLLNCVFRRDVIGPVRFGASYRGDYQFAKDIWERTKCTPWVKVRGVGGIHHLSWDTYDG